MEGVVLLDNVFGEPDFLAAVLYLGRCDLAWNPVREPIQ
jgi:hypothetical protein